MNPLIDMQSARAHKLAASAPSWLKIRSPSTGRVIGYGVPSQSQTGLYHKANATTCDCKAWEYRHTCIHQRAVELHEMATLDRPATEMPASAALDGLAQMVADRQAAELFQSTVTTARPQGRISPGAFSTVYSREEQLDGHTGRVVVSEREDS